MSSRVAARLDEHGEGRVGVPSFSTAAGKLLALALPSGRTGELIAGLGSALVEGSQIYCLDGGNVFDPYPLIDRLRRQGLDPSPILAERLFVSRTFTCHQLAGSVRMLLGPLAEEPEPPLALILGVDRLFLDEDIPSYERRHLFDRILADAEALRRRRLPVLMTCGAELGNPWTRRLSEAALLFSNPAAALKQLEFHTDSAMPWEGA